MKKLFLIIVICLIIASCAKDNPQYSYRMNCMGIYPQIECILYSDYQIGMNFYFNIDGKIYKFNYNLKQGKNKMIFNLIGIKCPDTWGFIKKEFQ